MKIVAVEEHFLTPSVKTAWQQSLDKDDPTLKLHFGDIEARLEDVSEERLRLMDESGVDIQVLSLTSPSLHDLGAESVALAKETNDHLAQAISTAPARFQGLAALPMPVPQEAARELERSVTSLGLQGAMLCGRTGEKNLDHKDFWGVFECAEALQVPLFIHPQVPRKGVRDAYYAGFDPITDVAFSTFGLGWHYEAGIQFLRLILGGVFDRFPKLQVILGHWGEVVLFYTERLASLNRVTRLDKQVLDYFRENLYVTASGMFSQTYLQRSLEIVGADRILFSTDYPFQYKPGRTARTFLEESGLEDDDRQKFASGNWERLVGARR